MRRISLLVVVALLATTLPGSVATAQETDTVRIKVDPIAKVLGDGQAVRVKVKVACEPPAVVLEASVFAQQDEQTVWGEAGIASVVCDGNSHVRFVEVNALEGQFHRGEAHVSAFVLVCLDPDCGETADGGDTRTVKVVGGRR